MSAISPGSADSSPRGEVSALVGLLALAIGLPFLGFFVLRHITSTQNIAALSALVGNAWSWREYVVAFFISPVVVPALWCAAATYLASSRAPRGVRTMTGVLLAATIVWAVMLALRIATI